jgi:branched-chain amino acid transport system permease protein
MATQSHYAGAVPAQRQGSQTLKWAALAVLLGLALVAPFQL